MTGLPAARPNEVIAVLKKIGYSVDHQTGSHVVMYIQGHLPVVVPRHNRDLKKGTFHQILRSASLSIDDFLRLK